MAKKTAVIGVLSTVSQAEALVVDLQRVGFASNDISVLLPDKRGTREFAHEKNTKAPEGAIAGVGAGGVISGTLGVLAGIGALAIPGLGPFIAAGPIMAGLSGAAAGATIGGVAGVLIGMGVPEFEAKQYQARLKEGGILMSVHIDTAEEKRLAKKLLEEKGAKHIVSTGESRVSDARHA